MNEMKMLSMLQFFFENPYEEVYLRELAKKIKLSPSAVKKYADALINKKLIIEEKKAHLRFFKANVGCLLFKHLKISYSINKIVSSKLIDFLKENLVNVSSIVLFGSAARGEDDENSDLDLVVIGKKGKPFNIRNIEKKLNKEINLHVYSWADWNKKANEKNPFYFEVISHGIALEGELPVIR